MNFGGTIRLNRVGVCVICAIVILIVFYISPGNERTVSSVQTKVNLRIVLVASIVAAERGGQEVVKVKTHHDVNERSKGKTKEGKDMLVTNADDKSHCVMYYGLSKLFPFIKIKSEEKVKKAECTNFHDLELSTTASGIENLEDREVDVSKLTIWIDPLDATQEYTEDILDCVTTMVCVAYEGNPIIGVIHKPFGEEPKTSWAWLNQGYSPHLKPYTNITETKTVIVSRSHAGEVKNMLKKSFGDKVNIVDAGGAGYKVLEVIKGNVTAYLHVTEIKKWDICAGDALMSSVGGRLTTLDNKDIDYRSDEEKNSRGVLATMNSADHARILKVFAKQSV